MCFPSPPVGSSVLSSSQLLGPEIARAHIRARMSVVSSPVCVCVCVFKYTWGLRECDPVLGGRAAASCVMRQLCADESLPVSLRRAPLPPCLQLGFIRCIKAFAQRLWCLCCFAAPLHCSPSVNACCCLSEYVLSDMY